jgi:cell division protein FtsB
MKILGAILVGLIVLIQYPLWFGKGGWLRVSEVNRQLDAQQEKNRVLEARNAALAAEVRDLKQGTEAIEERARYELGLIRADEIFIQVVPDKKQ